MVTLLLLLQTFPELSCWQQPARQNAASTPKKLHICIRGLVLIAHHVNQSNTTPYHPFHICELLGSRMSIRLLATFTVLCAARDITFPPIAGVTPQQAFLQEDVDISTGSAFAGLTTYANLPYVHCLADEKEKLQLYDIAVLGAPFDTVSEIPSFLIHQYCRTRTKICTNPCETNCTLGSNRSTRRTLRAGWNSPWLSTYHR